MSEENKEPQTKEPEIKTIRVSVKDEVYQQLQERLRQLEEELREEREEKQDLKEKLTIIAEQQFLKKKAELGCTDPTIQTPEQLEIWQRAKYGDKKEKPAGVAPLNKYQQYGAENQGYDSYEDMINDLRRRENQGDKEAKAILDEMFKKSFAGMPKSGKLLEFTGDVREQLQSTTPKPKRFENIDDEEYERLSRKKSKKPHPKSPIVIEGEK